MGWVRRQSKIRYYYGRYEEKAVKRHGYPRFEVKRDIEEVLKNSRSVYEIDKLQEGK